MTPHGREQDVDPDLLVDHVRADYAARKAPANANTPIGIADEAALPEIVPGADDLDARETWRERLTRRLLAMPSDAFERLCQRILRESGFIEVKVTGQSGDGGIDGIGILRLQRVVSFQVHF